MAYQAELEKEMTAKPDAKLWEEICVVTDNCLHLLKVVFQATGRAMGLIVFQEKAGWLNLYNLATRDKEDLLDTLVVPQGLFGSALASVQKRCEDRNNEAQKL